MKAILLAGGFGKRLHPLTASLPKPLVPICFKPVMQYVLELLKNHGIKEIVVLLHHQPHLIKEYFGDGSRFGVKIDYVFAGEDYGTAGAVKFARDYIKGPFLVIAADLLTNIDITKAIKFHTDKKSKATIVLTKVPNPLEYGIVITSSDGRIEHFLEKPSWEEVFSDYINSGVYIFEEEILDLIPDKIFFDFSKNLFPKFLERKMPFYGFETESYWKDIGNLNEYMQANKDAFDLNLFDCKSFDLKKSTISKSAVLEGKFIIGDNCLIGDDVVIKNSIISSNCVINRGAKIIGSILWDSVEIGKESYLKDSIIASSAKIGERAKIGEGCVVGHGTIIGSDSTIKPFVKIWPGKIIEEGSVVNSNMIWKQRWSKNIFGQYGVTGVCNVDLTAEFAAKLGSAFGAMLGKGATVTSSMDGHRASRMISRGLISGLLSAGVNVSNLETVPAPINRFELKALKSKGGIHVRRSPFDRNIIDIKFFDDDGTDLSISKEKEIEKLFWAEDYERPSIDETGEISFPFYRVAEGYKEAILNFVDVDAIKKRKFKIVLDYSFGSASQIFPSILGELDCETIALNAYIDENKFTKTKDDFERSLKQLSQIVITLKADFGVMFDAGAEKIFLVDEKGSVLDGQVGLLLFVNLVISYGSKKPIAVPANASSAIEELAKQKNINVIRSRTSLHSIMETASKYELQFVGEDTGGYIFPEFHPSFDAMLSTVKLLSMLSNCGCPMSSVVNALPLRSIAKETLPCPNSLKGLIIRKFFEDNKAKNVTLFDGVKIQDGSDWILITGHPDKQEIVLYSESDRFDSAKKMILFYKNEIKKMISEQLKK